MQTEKTLLTFPPFATVYSSQFPSQATLNSAKHQDLGTRKLGRGSRVTIFGEGHTRFRVERRDNTRLIRILRGNYLTTLGLVEVSLYLKLPKSHTIKIITTVSRQNLPLAVRSSFEQFVEITFLEAT